jgi:hypothetical protein
VRSSAAKAFRPRAPSVGISSAHRTLGEQHSLFLFNAHFRHDLWVRWANTAQANRASLPGFRLNAESRPPKALK